ncbi:MAG: protoheme IX farnesyltransferase [Alphaproteobacteria bacterium]|nr:protoheme IX farnesyltransferase [Alphaproteobacteria bacterium]
MADAAYLSQTSDTPLPAAPVSRVLDFVALLKPRVMTLVVFSGAVGLFIAPGALHPLLAVVAILCIAVGSGAAGAINMWYDRDIDALMSRTASRPLPGGRIAPDDALGFAIILALFSVLLMGLATNWVAAGLLALAILFYLFVYTIWLKRRTPQNIVIGGAAGAFPPMIGWAAVNGDVSFVSLSLFAIIFLWTPPHFWALALYRSGDYERAGVPMMPVVAGSRSTKRQMLVYTLFLVPASLVPFMLGAAGLLYATGVGLLGLFFIVSATRVLREASDAGHRCARQMFSFSILYLFLVFALLLVDSLLVLAG